MASPPFSLSISSPGNTDIAAVFPALDRSDKDVIQSWITQQMNNQGHDLFTLIDKKGSANGPVSAPTPSANTIAIYYDTDASLKQYAGDLATVEYVGVPPGTVLDYAGTAAPAGYILLTGIAGGAVQNVSRTTFARLFAALGSTWGAGDGSTTFGLPPGQDVFYGGAGNASGLGAIGSKGGSFSITTNNLPGYTLFGSVGAGQGSHVHGLTGGSIVGTGSTNVSVGGGALNIPFATATLGIAAATLPAMNCSVWSGGSGSAYAPPYAALYKIIKF
jgi:hypothetical protein